MGGVLHPHELSIRALAYGLRRSNMVCAETLGLRAAQHAIAVDSVSVYGRYV